MDKISIFWFRRDLRLHDNVALFNALNNATLSCNRRSLRNQNIEILSINY